MLEEVVATLKRELRQLEGVVQQLTGDWEVTAAEEPAILVPFPVRDQLYKKLLFHGADTGPPPLPEGCYPCCKHLERGTIRASRAFNIGFWAKAAIDCHIPYEADLPFPGVIPSQWLILRGDHPLIPCRVYSEEEAVRLVGDSVNPIVESFESLAEVNLFCIGASQDVPQLVKWKSQ